MESTEPYIDFTTYHCSFFEIKFFWKYIRKICKFRKYFRKICNFEKNVNGRWSHYKIKFSNFISWLDCISFQDLVGAANETPVTNFLCAVTAGAVSSAIANPTDVLKVRLQSGTSTSSTHHQRLTPSKSPPSSSALKSQTNVKQGSLRFLLIVPQSFRFFCSGSLKAWQL